MVTWVRRASNDPGKNLRLPFETWSIIRGKRLSSLPLSPSLPPPPTRFMHQMYRNFFNKTHLTKRCRRRKTDRCTPKIFRTSNSDHRTCVVRINICQCQKVNNFIAIMTIPPYINTRHTIYRIVYKGGGVIIIMVTWVRRASNDPGKNLRLPFETWSIIRGKRLSSLPLSPSLPPPPPTVHQPILP